jgi:hypothetical protein
MPARYFETATVRFGFLRNSEVDPRQLLRWLRSDSGVALSAEVPRFNQSPSVMVEHEQEMMNRFVGHCAPPDI